MGGNDEPASASGSPAWSSSRRSSFCCTWWWCVGVAPPWPAWRPWPSLRRSRPCCSAPRSGRPLPSEPAGPPHSWETWLSNTLSLDALPARTLDGGPGMAPLGHWPWAARVVTGLAAAGLGWTALSLTRETGGRRAPSLDGALFALWAVLVVVLNPLAWSHYAIMLVLPALLILAMAADPGVSLTTGARRVVFAMVGRGPDPPVGPQRDALSAHRSRARDAGPLGGISGASLRRRSPALRGRGLPRPAAPEWLARGRPPREGAGSRRRGEPRPAVTGSGGSARGPTRRGRPLDSSPQPEVASSRRCRRESSPATTGIPAWPAAPPNPSTARQPLTRGGMRCL